MQPRPRRRRPDDARWMACALLAVIVVAVSLLYCAGLGGLIARSVLLATPTPPGATDWLPPWTDRQGGLDDDLPSLDLTFTPPLTVTAALTPQP